MFLIRKFRLFDAFGIPIYLDASTAILLVFFLGMTGSLLLDLAAVAVLWQPR